jgi:hypothetical protein
LRTIWRLCLSGTTLSLIGAAPGRPSEEEVRAKLDEVFSRPEFSPPPDNSWLRHVLEWLSNFFSFLGGLREAAPIFYWLLLGACIALLLVLLGHIVLSVRRVLYAGASGGGPDGSQAKRERLSRVYADEAHRRAAERDFTEAVRFLFLSLIYRFDETGRVSFLKSYTNREYLQVFEDRSGIHSQMNVFVDILDDHWYGQRSTEAREYESCRRLYEGLL